MLLAKTAPRRRILAHAAAALALLSLPAAAFAQARDLEVPYVPTPPAVVEAMLDMADVQKGEYLIDLGSGDGRIPIAAAKRGARAFGVDLDPQRVSEAIAKARFEGVQGVRFRRQDLFATPIREADVVTLYLLRSLNLRLRPRLLTELRPGTRVVSHGFDMGDWRPDRHATVGGANIYLWTIPAPVAGRWRDAASGTVLTLDQRFQEVSGTLAAAAIAEASLSGDRLRFTAEIDGRRQPFDLRAVDDRLEDAEGGDRRFFRID
jgi:SAM-dependent methyltransferase